MYLQFYINDNGDKVYTTKRKRQLEKLRKLYLIDMLKWQHNEKRVQVHKETALYIKSEKDKMKSGRAATKKS